MATLLCVSIFAFSTADSRGQKPVVTGISPPNPVALEEPQLLTIYGYDFPTNAIIWFYDCADKKRRRITEIDFLTETNIGLRPKLGTSNARWGIIIENPGGTNSDEFTFKVRALGAVPVITRIIPNPAKGSVDPQFLIINGHDFLPGCSVKLLDKTKAKELPGVEVKGTTSSQIVVAARLTANSRTWSVRVRNPSGDPSVEYSFDVISAARWRWYHWIRSPYNILALTSFIGLALSLLMWKRAAKRKAHALAHFKTTVTSLKHERDEATLRSGRAFRMDLHDRVSSDIARICSGTEVAKELLAHGQEVSTVAHKLDTVQLLTRNLQMNLEELEWIADPVNSNLKALLNRLRAKPAERLTNAGIDFTISAPTEAEVPSLEIQPHWANQVLMITNEVFNNIVKHSKAAHVTYYVQLSTVPVRQIEIGITDDGIGISQAVLETPTRGILGMKNRAVLLGANLRLHRLEKGTHVTLVAPISFATKPRPQRLVRPKTVSNHFPTHT